MITDDISPLFAQGQPGVRFRQGTVLTWDAETGENTIDLAGGTLTDVPILNTGEAIALKAGHVVGLLGQGKSWFIIGRVTPPNDPNFASASVAFGGEGASSLNFSITTSHLDKVTDTMAVPDWVDEAIVLCTVNATIANTTANTYYVSMVAVIDGTPGGQAATGLGPNGSSVDLAAVSCSAQRRITNPGSTISFAAQMWTTSGTVPASGATIVNLDAIAIFRSTV